MKKTGIRLVALLLCGTLLPLEMMLLLLCPVLLLMHLGLTGILPPTV